MKKIMIALIVLSINSNTLKAQKGVKEIGLQGGLISSNFWASDAIPKKDNLKTYFVGLTYGYSLNKMFSLRANLSYETKGDETRIPPTDPFGNQLNGYTAYKLNYTTLHLLTRGGFGEKVHCYLEAGAFVSYLINANAVGISYGADTAYYGKTIDITSRFKNINIGASAGVGATYPITKKIKINLTVRRSIGLTSINKNAYTFFEAKTNSLQIFTGIDLKL